MEKLGVKKSGVLAVLLIALFATSVFSMMPVISNAAQFNRYETIKIGVIAPFDDALTPLTQLYKQVVEPNINTYVAKLPTSRFTLPVKFEFQVVSAGTGTAAEHFAQVKMFHKMGVDLIIGGWMSSQIDQQTLDYLTKNNMVMISPGSNAPSLAYKDNLFRLLPDSSTEGIIVAAMFAKLAKTNAIVIKREDSYGNGVYNAFLSSFTGGGTVSCYSYTPDTNVKTNFQKALNNANTGAGGLSDVGVFIIAIDTDCADQLNSASFATDYPNLGKLPWLGADGTAFSSFLTEPNVGALKILSPNPATPHNTKFDYMNSKYSKILGPMDYAGACMIDAGWILAQAVIETRSTTFLKSPGATDVIKVLSDDCSRYFGYSGWCLLDKNGDRVSTNWEIWGYGLSGGNTVILQYGSYDSYSGTVSWIITPTWP